MGYDKEKAAKRNKQRSINNQIKLAAYKLELGCVDCGYRDSPFALEFDHLPDYKKSRTVASLTYHAWERIMEEAKKCEVVCANCHAVRTAIRAGWHITPG